MKFLSVYLFIPFIFGSGWLHDVDDLALFLGITELLALLLRCDCAAGLQ